MYYRVIPKSELSTLAFDAHCSVPEDNGYYFKFTESGSTLTHAPVSVNITNANTNVLAYCVEDNA